MPLSFGQVIGVTGPVNGFQGTVSRFGDRVIVAREFVPYTTSNNLNFGDPAVLLPSVGNGGGSWDSVADFIAHATANIGLLAGLYAGFAVREVQSQLTYGAGVTPGTNQVGYYYATQMAEVCERGNGTILLSVGAPKAGDQVYTRVVVNAAVPAGFIGDWETNPAASDLFTSVLPSGVINSTTLTFNTTLANAQVGSVVTGLGIAAGTYIVSGTGGAGAFTAVVLSNALQQTVTAGTPITISNLVALPSTVARTGNLDANNILEITVKNRVAA